VVYTILNDKFIFILKSLNEDAAVFFDQLKRICEEIRVSILNMNCFTVTIGVGNHEPSVMNVHRSYECAKKAVTLGRIKYKCNKVIFYDELGVQKLLSLIYENKEAKEFYLTNLQKLIDYDNNNNMDLLKTLRYIVHNDWNLKETSKEMYVHYNTIKYRFNVIKEIMGIDFKKFEQKLSIAISLELMEMSE
jgi:purine catabolism regulator